MVSEPRGNEKLEGTAAARPIPVGVERRGQPPAAEVRPRHAVADSFEQNPLSAVTARVTAQAIAGMSDSERVREALRDVLERRDGLAEAARTWQVAPSALSEWQRRYAAFLEEELNVAERPLMEGGGMARDADLVTVPEAAREMFQANWERMVEVSRVTEASFRQRPWRLFLENSWMTGWMFTDGKLERNSLAGLVVAVVSVVAIGAVLAGGKLIRREEAVAVEEEVVDDEEVISRAAAVAQEFFLAGDVEGKLRVLRGGEGVQREASEYFRARGVAVIADAVLSRGMTSRGITSLEFEVPSQQRTHLINVVERGGVMKMDWETSSLYQEGHLAGLREKKPNGLERVVVKVARDNYYNYGFGEAGYECFRLTYPGLVLDLYGYVARDTAEHVKLDTMLRAKEMIGEEPVEAVVLEVRYPEKAKAANQVEVVRVLKDQWLTD
jgi:transposase-like protein